LSLVLQLPQFLLFSSIIHSIAEAVIFTTASSQFQTHIFPASSSFVGREQYSE
jgi:hypothetical protein